MFLIFSLVSTIASSQLPGYYFYKTLTINASQVNGSGSHVNFPVLISETDADLAHLSFGGDVQNINGYDIAFTAADGITLLDHQIEDYDETDGDLDVWVRIPLLSTTVDTEIRMYYGNGQVTTDPSTDNVWDANYAAVYHLTDDFLDKTNNNNDLTNNGTLNVGNAQVAKGRNFNTNNFLEAPNSASIAINGDITISTWVDVNILQPGPVDNLLVSFGGLLEILLDNHVYWFNIRDDNRLTFLWEYGVGFDEIMSSVNPITIPATGFTMLSVSRDVTTNEVNFYQDGVLLDLAPTTYTNDPMGGTLGVLRIGENYQYPNFDFDGAQDEIRISNIVRSKEWLNTEFNTINDPSTFYIKGPEVKLFGIWEWLDEASTVNEEWGNDVVVDTLNQFVYTAGTMTDRTAFGIPAGKLNGGSDNGNKDGFLAKHDFNGNLIWVVNMGGNLADEATGVAIDEFGNPYVSGYYTNYIAAHSTDLSQDNPGGAEGGEDIFIAKYSPAGILDWIIAEGGSGNDRAHAITVSSGALFVTGVYQNSADFGSYSTESTNNSVSNTFLSRHKLVDGEAEWLMEVKSEGEDFHTTQTIQNSSMDIATIKDTVYVVGYMGGASLRFVEGDGTLLASPILTDANTAGKDIFIYAADTSGALIWAQKIDNIDSPNQLGLGISADCDGIYVAGMIHDGAIFPGPDVVGTTFHDKMFISKFQHGDGTEVWLKEFDNSPTNHVDLFHDIKADGYGNLFICGTALDAISNADTSLAATTEQSAVIFKYGNDGTFQWAEQSTGSGNDIPYAIDTYRKDNVFMTGEYTDNFQLASVIVPATTNDRNFFLTKMTTLGNGTKLTCCPPPSFDVCQGDTTVTADPSCNHTLADYTLLVSAIDYCGGGLTYTQSPITSTVLSSGTHEIAVYVQDSEGNIDSCTFNLIIEADVNPVVVDCGDLLVAQNTSGAGNTQDTWSCDGQTTLGEDIYYQITVPAGNYLLGTKILNASDLDDGALKVFWVGGACPLTSTCLFSDEFNITDQDFDSNGQNQLLFNAVGPGTYYFVVDSESAGSSTFDIEFNCIVSGIEFDESNCNLNDADLNGVSTLVDGATTLKVEPCQNVTICNEIITKNVNGGEWLDTVVMQLGPCYTNITNMAPTAPGANGSYNLGGTWNAVYNSVDNTIEWGFNHSSINLWGDGTGGAGYACRDFTFCFDADISATCIDNDSLDVIILITDDAVNGAVPGVAQGFDYAYQDSLSLTATPDPGWTYASTSFCQGDANPNPTISGTAGGTFSSTAGLVWADQPNGIIDLAGSTAGSYDITYTVGFCLIDSVINITINAEDDPFFDYPSTTYCAADADPSPSNVATAGGTYSSTAGLIWANQPNGIVDLSASTPATYTITYTTTTGTCPNAATFSVTIVAEDDATFSYSALAYCEGESDQLPITIVTPGGNFSASSGSLDIDNGDGEVEIDDSSVGNYTIYYTTSGTCPNIDSVQFEIIAEDDPFFDYSATSFCAADADPSPTNIATAGGTYSSTAGLIWANQPNGMIDLSASTPGAYATTYLTGGTCPNSTTFDLTIVAEDDPFFDFPSIAYCAADNDPSPTNVATTGGTYSSTVGLVWDDQPNGIIDLSASTPATYTITYTTTGTCPNAATFSVTIVAEDDATFSYSALAYCEGESDQLPITIVTPGGNFSASSGSLDIDNGDGEVEIDDSSVGNYTIYYTTSGTCPNIDSVQFEIIAEDDPFFDYSATSFCAADADPSPTNVATTGGTYASTAGLVWANQTNGIIDLSASTPATYTITYTTTGACPNSTTFDVTIVAEDDPFFDYPEASYCQYDTDPVATNIAVPGGMFTVPIGVSLLNNSTGEIDLSASTPGGPYSLSYMTNGVCPNFSTFDITILSVDDPSFDYPQASYCQGDVDPIGTNMVTPGGTFSAPTGVVLLNATTGEIDLDASTAGGPYSIQYITQGNCPDSTTFDITIIPLDNANFDYPQSAYCQYETDPIATNIAAAGGFTGPLEIVFLNTTTGEIDLDASTVGGPYTITYLTTGPCPNTATFEITINSADNPAFDYPQSAYCQSENNPTATNIVLAGGTFSAPADVVILNTTSGLIDLNASTPGGPYTIKYVTGGICPDSATFDITINADDLPYFDYPSDLYCTTDDNVVANISGTLGGTFVTSAGLSLVDSNTGEINIQSSTLGSHTITYTTAGPDCPTDSTITIEIGGQENPTFSYLNPEYCITDDNPIPTAVTPGGYFSAISSGLILDTLTGEVDLFNSTSAQHVIEYITATGCADSSQTTISIIAEPVSNAGLDQLLNFTNSAVLNASGSNYLSGYWTSSNSSLIFEEETDSNTTVSELTVGLNELFWTIDNGICPEVSDQVFITVKGIFVPDVVTPNGDNKNETFEIIGIENTINKIQIFNRWGQIVFETEDYQNDWNGNNMSGVSLEDDTYFYILIVNETEKYNGYIVLKR